ncbi:MAG TPA: hypothetical protein VLH86_03075, partial [Patescibacteria group bacterium]|nr:hypothetical protein [Patescibacteria group bacterium]
MSRVITAYAHYKQSGEKIAGPNGYGIGADNLLRSARRLQALHQQAGALGVGVTIVSGGGNFLRKTDFINGYTGSEPLPAELLDEIDTTARWGTVDNARAIGGALNAIGVPATVLLAPGMEQFDSRWGKSLPNTVENRMEVMAAGRVGVIGGGTGGNKCTTDAAVAQITQEQAIFNLQAADGDPDAAAKAYAFKATQVNNVYNRDPHQPGEGELIAYDVVSAAEMLASPGDYGVSPEDLLRHPEKMGVVDTLTVEILAAAPEGAPVSLNVYNGDRYSPVEALAAMQSGNHIGTLIVPNFA